MAALQTKMSAILKKLGIGQLTETFEREKITPDLICKLSVHQLEVLGLSNRSDMMKLRIECSTFGNQDQHASKVHESCGAPAYFIPKNVLENHLGEGFKIAEIAQILNVSESTIYRRMRYFGLSKWNFSDISDEDLDRQLQTICRDFPNCGEEMLKHLLEEKGLKVQRMRLRDSLHRVDMVGVEERKRRKRHRRICDVEGPNHLWHIDTNHKLVRWHFVVVGGVDGFSRLPVFSCCKDNNKASTVLQCFVEGVEKYGLPSRVRSDKGMENVDVADYVILRMGVDRGNMITGKSTHNQRIVRLWRDVFKGVLGFYYHLFYFMEDKHILDPLSEHHTDALHHVYLHSMNRKLELWRQAWSHHRMRTTRSSPLRLWIAGQLQNPVGIEQTATEIADYGVDGIIRNDGDGDSRPIFAPPPPSYQMSAACFAELNAEVPSQWTSSNYGIELYVKAVNIIERHNT